MHANAQDTRAFCRQTIHLLYLTVEKRCQFASLRGRQTRESDLSTGMDNAFDVLKEF